MIYIDLQEQNSMVIEYDQKKHCPKCGSKEVKLNGKTRLGKQRYQCLRCKKSYIWKQSISIDEKRKQWFKEWIVEGYTIKQISGKHKVSRSTASRVIEYWLKKEPPEAGDLTGVKNIILDGTYLQHRTGIYLIMNAEGHRVIFGRYGVNETGKQLKIIFEELYKKGLKPVSATVDGALQQQKYLKLVWNDLLLQRCLVHIRRQGLSWLRKTPKRIEAMELRDLLLQLLEIQTREQAQNFIKGFLVWEQRYGYQLDISTNRGKVFSDLLRTRSMILNALSDMFAYLDNPDIPRTTNPLEGYIGRLKQKYRAHSGLSPKKRKNFFSWYFYLKPI